MIAQYVYNNKKMNTKKYQQNKLKVSIKVHVHIMRQKRSERYDVMKNYVEQL